MPFNLIYREKLNYVSPEQLVISILIKTCVASFIELLSVLRVHANFYRYLS